VILSSPGAQKAKAGGLSTLSKAVRHISKNGLRTDALGLYYWRELQHSLVCIPGRQTNTAKRHTATTIDFHVAHCRGDAISNRAAQRSIKHLIPQLQAPEGAPDWEELNVDKVVAGAGALDWLIWVSLGPVPVGVPTPFLASIRSRLLILSMTFASKFSEYESSEELTTLGKSGPQGSPSAISLLQSVGC
jgi:hypothetical protein